VGAVTDGVLLRTKTFSHIHTYRRFLDGVKYIKIMYGLQVYDAM
jgi:hypothetical protein